MADRLTEQIDLVNLPLWVISDDIHGPPVSEDFVGRSDYISTQFSYVPRSKILESIRFFIKSIIWEYLQSRCKSDIVCQYYATRGPISYTVLSSSRHKWPKDEPTRYLPFYSDYKLE